MKKIFILLLALVVVVSCVFAACSNSESDNETTAAGLENNDNEFGFETQEVTDENGETVTDENGNPVTTQVAVIYKTDKNGKRYAQVLDADGNPIEGETIAVNDQDD